MDGNNMALAARATLTERISSIIKLKSSNAAFSWYGARFGVQTRIENAKEIFEGASAEVEKYLVTWARRA